MDPGQSRVIARICRHRILWGLLSDIMVWSYLQRSALPIVLHGNDLITRSSLEFEFISTGTLAHGSVTTFKSALMRIWSTSLIFGTVEPERLLTPYSNFHI